jgi:hypothetical protein
MYCEWERRNAEKFQRGSSWKAAKALKKEAASFGETYAIFTF